MKIKILGNGGMINDGLPYNSFMIDDKFLIETPPDIMNSLYRENADLSKIQSVYISHFHGDHFFGLPFLALRLFFNSLSETSKGKIRIIGPRNIKTKTEEICRLAVGENHPLHQWIDDNVIFIEITADDEVLLENDISIKCFSMKHFVETWGFSLYSKNRILFSYFADTLFDESLIKQLELSPKIIIADMNGEPSDTVKVHLSEKDLLDLMIPLCGGRTVFYGTHLKHQKESTQNNLKYTHPGGIIEL